MYKPGKSIKSNSFFMPLYDEYLKTIGPNKHNYPDDFTRYVQDVFVCYNSLYESIERVKFALFFINKYKYSKQHLNINLDREKYYQYHLSMIYTVGSSLSDQILLLINSVLQLGLNETEVNRRTVIHNKHCTKDIQNAFNKLENFMANEKDIKRMRNLFVHRGQIDIKEFNSIANDLDIGTSPDLPFSGSKEFKVLQKWLKERGMIAHKIALADLEKTAGDIDEKAANIIDLLTGTFQAKSQGLRQTNL